MFWLRRKDKKKQIKNFMPRNLLQITDVLVRNRIFLSILYTTN